MKRGSQQLLGNPLLSSGYSNDPQIAYNEKENKIKQQSMVKGSMLSDGFQSSCINPQAQQLGSIIRRFVHYAYSKNCSTSLHSE